MRRLLMMGFVVFGIAMTSQGALTHMLHDPGTTQVFFDDFSGSSYSTNWTTYTSASSATFALDGGYAKAQITSGDTYAYADFFSRGSLDVSSSSGKKTEVVMAQCNFNDWAYSRTLLVNSQNPSGQGFCVEHLKYPDGQVRLSLYNGNVTTILYDSGPIFPGAWQYLYSTSLVVDPVTGQWAFGWADGANGVTTPLASGTLTADQKATYLSGTMYIGTGIYSDGSADTSNNFNLTDEVAVYQVTEAAPPVFSPGYLYTNIPTRVTMTSATTGATIYYTDDGMEPTISSKQYSGPVLVTGDMTLKAIAVASGLDPSTITSQKYTLLQTTLSHLMNDPNTGLVFADDFQDGDYSSNWVTYATNQAMPIFTEADGMLKAQTASQMGEQYAGFFSKSNFNVHLNKTEFVVAQCNMNTYVYNRTFLLNTQNPWGKGFCIEHQKFPTGDLRVSLYNNGAMVQLFDGTDRESYEYAHSFSFMADPKTGDWTVGWVWNTTGEVVTVGKGRLTAEQIATYLNEPLYLGVGIYTGGSDEDETTSCNVVYDVAVFQSTVPEAGELFTDNFNTLDTSRWFTVTSQAALGKVYLNADNVRSQIVNFFNDGNAATADSREVSITSGGQLALPINAGKTDELVNNYSNVMVARAPEDWKYITVKIKGSTAFDDPLGWNQFTIVLWNDDDNYVKFGFDHYDSTSDDPQAGHILVGGTIETAAICHTEFGGINDTVSNANDLILQIEKNTNGTYKYSISTDNGVTMTLVADNVAFADADGSNVQTPNYIGVYAGAGRWTGTYGSDWWTYDPTSNRSVNVLVDSFQVSLTAPVLKISGDANGDGAVNVSDLSLLAANYGKTSGATWAMGDFTGDGAVNVSDLSLLAANYGTGSKSTMSWADAYAQAFGTTDDSSALSDDSNGDTASSACSSLGLSLIAGILLVGLMLMKYEE